jgi:hypothetical protein
VTVQKLTSLRTPASVRVKFAVVADQPQSGAGIRRRGVGELPVRCDERDVETELRPSRQGTAIRKRRHPILYPAEVRWDTAPEFVADSKEPDNSWVGGHRCSLRRHLVEPGLRCEADVISERTGQILTSRALPRLADISHPALR